MEWFNQLTNKQTKLVIAGYFIALIITSVSIY
jgi:hypothetical protein